VRWAVGGLQPQGCETKIDAAVKIASRRIDKVIRALSRPSDERWGQVRSPTFPTRCDARKIDEGHKENNDETPDEDWFNAAGIVGRVRRFAPHSDRAEGVTPWRIRVFI
jgi:hypothetical protein